MKWWAKSRMLALLAAITVAAAVLCLPGAGVLVSLPNLTGGPDFASPVSFLIPLAAVVAYCQGLARQDVTLEYQAVRRVWLADLGVAAACCAVFAAGLIVDHGDTMLATVRNTLGFFGAALIGTWLIDLSKAALVPVIWSLLAGLGGLPLGDVALTTWPSRPAADAGSWIVAGALALVGPAAYLAHHAPVADRLARRLRPATG